MEWLKELVKFGVDKQGGKKMVLTLLEEHENLFMSRATDTPWCLRWSPWALLHPFRDGEVQTQKDVEKWINQSLDDQR